MYKVIISPRAKRDLRSIEKQYRQSLAKVIEEIKADPLAGKPLSKELSGRFSWRVGVYRIVYQVNKQNQTIYVSTAGHRGKVYKRS